MSACSVVREPPSRDRSAFEAHRSRVVRRAPAGAVPPPVVGPAAPGAAADTAPPGSSAPGPAAADPAVPESAAAGSAAPGPIVLDPTGPGCGTGVAQLWRAFLARPDRRLRDRLVLHHTPLLHAVAHRVAQGLPAHVDLADLVQAGVFGLVDAVERFDPQRSPRFEAYAAQRIRGAILDDLRAQDWVPRSVRGRAREVERAQERLEARLQRTATDQELADELGLPVRAVGSARRAAVVEALDDLGAGGGADLLVDEQAQDPLALLQSRETARQLATAVGLLAERDRTVVRLYYVENRTLAEIGRHLGVTESRVCQLHARVVSRLRVRMAEVAAG
jgi:RNA polymerase sigma factor FliA